MISILWSGDGVIYALRIQDSYLNLSRFAVCLQWQCICHGVTLWEQHPREINTWLSQVSCDVSIHPVSDEQAAAACHNRLFVWVTLSKRGVSFFFFFFGIWQTGWMETGPRTMSHNHAVDFTARLCIPGPTKESCTQHPHGYTEHCLREPGGGPLLLFTCLKRTWVKMLLKNWNYKSTKCLRWWFTNKEPLQYVEYGTNND